MEARAVPDLVVVRGLLVEVLGQGGDLEADLAATRLVEQEADVVGGAAPVLGGLAVVDAAELQRDEPVEVGDVVEVEAG